MKLFKNFVQLFILIVFISAQEKILFVGNSFTFYWNLPSLVESMAMEKGIKLDIYQSTAGSATLKDHWEGQRGLSTKKVIANNDFRTIILQEHSSSPLLKPAESKDYFIRFIKLVKEKKSEVILYGTWMYPAKPLIGKSFIGVDPIQEALRPISIKTGSRIAPVGTAFRLFQKEHPEISIYTSDNKHPSAVGTYLAACVFFKMITGESPLGLERRYERKDEYGKKVFLGMVEKSAALKCQAIVDGMDMQ
jgi:hypothetical protein